VAYVPGVLMKGDLKVVNGKGAKPRPFLMPKERHLDITNNSASDCLVLIYMFLHSFRWIRWQVGCPKTGYR